MDVDATAVVAQVAKDHLDATMDEHPDDLVTEAAEHGAEALNDPDEMTPEEIDAGAFPPRGAWLLRARVAARGAARLGVPEHALGASAAFRRSGREVLQVEVRVA